MGPSSCPVSAQCWELGTRSRRGLDPRNLPEPAGWVKTGLAQSHPPGCMHILDTGCFVRAELALQPSEQRSSVCTAASSPPLSPAEPPGSHPAPQRAHAHARHIRGPV